MARPSKHDGVVYRRGESKMWLSFSKFPKELPERNKRPRSSRLVFNGTAE
jgi:hypothetical protein